MGCHSLLQGIFLTQGLNLTLPHCRQVLQTRRILQILLSHQGSPILNAFFYFCKFTLSIATGHFWARFLWIPCCQTHQTPSSLNHVCPLWGHFIPPTSSPWESVYNGNVVSQVLLPHVGTTEVFWLAENGLHWLLAKPYNMRVGNAQ